MTAVIGQHVHVVQPIRRVNGKPVVFGEGNLVSNQTAACCPAESQDGMIALIDFVRARSDRRAARRACATCPPGSRHPTIEVLSRGARLAVVASARSATPGAARRG